MSAQARWSEMQSIINLLDLWKKINNPNTRYDGANSLPVVRSAGALSAHGSRWLPPLLSYVNSWGKAGFNILEFYIEEDIGSYQILFDSELWLETLSRSWCPMLGFRTARGVSCLFPQY